MQIASRDFLVGNARLFGDLAAAHPPSAIDHARLKLLSIILISAGFMLGRPASAQTCPGAPPGNAQPGGYSPATDIPWAAWQTLLGLHWSDAQARGISWIDPAQLVKAAAAVPQETPDPDLMALGTDYYEPVEPARDETALVAYDKAASIYHLGDWTGAIAGFDGLMRLSDRGYRAAAAYSATRAVFYLGHYPEGIARLDRLLSDPALGEFHTAAHHLIGTLANQTGAAPLVAARFEEISHLLMAPDALICRDRDLQALRLEAENDLGRLMQGIYVPGQIARPDIALHTRRVLDAVAGLDPVMDLVRVMAAPSPFANGADEGWLETLPPMPGDLPHDRIEARNVAELEAAALTAHARAAWIATRNPLWAYALAIRTTEFRDLRPLFDALKALEAEAPPADPMLAGAETAIRRQLIGQTARLLVMTGHADTALDFLAAHNPTGLGRSGSGPPPADRIEAFIRDGGIRYFLEKRDLAEARHWESAVSSLFADYYAAGREDLDPDLALLLADDWDSAIEGLTGTDSLPLSAAAALDLQPAARLVALGRHPGLSAGTRRALLSAGWVRLYMLDRRPELIAAIPDMRAAFPELAPDLDQIAGTWMPWTSRRLMARLLLKTPGLSPRLLSARDVVLPKTPEIATVLGTSNDMNWWCPLDLERARVDALGQFLVHAVEPNKGFDYDTASMSGVSNGVFPKSAAVAKQRSDDAAKAMIAWHPLFRSVDWSELDRLAHAENGPRKLSEAAIAWADQSNGLTRRLGWDDDLAETLHLAVRSTRYGCQIAGAPGAYSHAAYTALHRLYPSTDWAKKTPFWFDRLIVKARPKPSP